MLRNILNALKAPTYWFNQDEPISWIQEAWTQWLWLVVLALGVIFLLTIIILFFKAIRNTRLRKQAKREAKEEKQRKKEEEKQTKKEQKRKKNEKRVVTGIALDTTVTQRDFKVGDDFNCEGLLVLATYNTEPTQETITDYKIVKERVFEKAANGKLEGVHVCIPDMKKVGKRTVRVCLNGQEAVYSISVAETLSDKPVEETKEEAKQEPVVLAAQPEEKPVERVVTGIALDYGVVRRDFLTGDEFNCDGLLVRASYNVAPLQETLANYTVVEPYVFDKAVTGEITGLYVCRPDLSKAGTATVRVCFNKVLDLYTISVKEKPVEAVKEEPKQEAVVAPVVEEPKQPARVITGITLDTGVVQRDFKVGDEFNCDGLLVNATFNAMPLQETIANYAVVDGATFDQAVSGSLEGLYVCRPDLSRSGKLAVRVCLNKHVALYTISVTERPVEQPKQPEPQVVQQVYAQPQQPQQQVGPREIISITVNTDYVRRDFYTGDTLSHDGLVVYAHYNREPFKEQVYNYNVIAPDMSRAGNPSVVVMFQGRAITYPITVRENPYKQQQQQYEQYAQPQQPQQPVVQKERVLTRVTVNADFAKKDYTVGEQFNREGLIVTAHYNVEPLQEQVTNFTVIPPDMSREGMATVMVAYQDRMVSYQVNVRPAPVVSKPEPVVTPQVEQPKAVRELLSVTLDTGVVQREFDVDEEFNCDGLLIHANYSLAPTLETTANYTIVDAASFDQIIRQASGCFVAEPDMSTAGRKVVRVSVNQQIALYTILVRKNEKKNEVEAEQVEPQPEPVVAPVAEEPVKAVRELNSITLDTGVVQREFEVGEEFNCDGLLVNGNYSLAPTLETYAEYMLVDAASFDQLLHADAEGVYVCKADTSTAGKKVVRVSLEKHVALYTISVKKPVEQPKEEVKEEVKPEPQVVVVEKEVVVTPERQMWYITLKTDDVQKTFTVGDYFSHEGLVVWAHHNGEPYMVQADNYTVTAPDMNVIGKYSVVVSYLGKSASYQVTIKPAPAVEEKQPEPQPVVVEAQPQPQVVVQQPSQIVVEEESYEGRLRYDRSFNARVIQSDDKTKYWYTDVKNELLSYKKVHGRISWKRETFKCGKAVVAKLAFRGNTLCLLLPLNVAEYADTKYKLEDVSNAPSNADTPAMLRLKSDKSVKQAIELIEEVMTNLDIDKDRKYQPEDFYVPYEGVFELIKKGLIKREIKTAADEAVFTGGQDDESEDDSYELTEVAPGVFVSPKK